MSVIIYPDGSTIENNGIPPKKTNFEVKDFKSIRNYIHNYLGLTKDEVRQIIREELVKIVHEQVEVELRDKEKIQQIIQKKIIDEIRRDYGKERRSYVISTMDEIYNKIDNVIHEEVLKRLVVSLREPERKEEMINGD